MQAKLCHSKAPDLCASLRPFTLQEYNKSYILIEGMLQKKGSKHHSIETTDNALQIPCMIMFGSSDISRNRKTNALFLKCSQ